MINIDSLRVALKNENLKLLKNININYKKKNSFFKCLKKKYQNDIIAESNQIGSRINKNFQLVKQEERSTNNDGPGNWPQNITNKLQIYLVKNPPTKCINFYFPSNDEGRKFSVIHYNRTKVNSENAIQKLAFVF